MRVHNHGMGFTNLLAFLSYILISINFTIAQKCDSAGDFATNSEYGRNRNLILSSIASNVSRNGGFYTATIGQGTNKVYALALCRGDSSPEICASSVTSATQDILSHCQNKKEAISWGADPPSIVRYANRSFFGKLELLPIRAGSNLENISSNLTIFNQTWKSLMDRLVPKASTGSSRLKFATAEANLTRSEMIYALMQCTPDISQSDCDFCLRTSVAEFEGCCHGKQGGNIQRPSCMFRWETFPFYGPPVADDLSESSLPGPGIIPPSPAPIVSPQLNHTRIIKDKRSITSLTLAIIVVSAIIFMAILATICVVLRRKKPKQEITSKSEIRMKLIKLDLGMVKFAGFSVDARIKPCYFNPNEKSCVASGRSMSLNADKIETVEAFQFPFSSIRAATNNFSIDSRLGQGGFGTVYKGRLPDGQDIAVKRLSRDSKQGELEFKNEVLLLAKLQHRNLVRLLGFCLKGNERLLIYEFVPNSSLDNFIFDSIKRLSIDWEIRLKIIRGIARGILYLHDDSRLRIIHRDLKASNILLSIDMNPKISDFGMARLFEMDETHGNTSRLVGTFGYMAPEYIKRGHYSVKSDVFGFGVLVLEIISGQKNSCFCNGEDAEDLLTHTWKNWMEGTASNLIDPLLTAGSNSEILRCIHIGLLCVQESLAARPTMAAIVLMLTNSSVSLPVPSKPAYYMHNTESDQSESDSILTVGEASIT